MYKITKEITYFPIEKESKADGSAEANTNETSLVISYIIDFN